MQGEGLSSDHIETKLNTYSTRTTSSNKSATPAGESLRAVFKAMRKDMVHEVSIAEEKKERTGEETIFNVIKQIRDQVQQLGEHEIELVKKDVRDLDTALKSESVFNKILHSIGERVSYSLASED